MKSTIDYIKYLVSQMEADQSITGVTILTDCLYTSIEATNWLRTLQKGRSGIPAELFDTQNRFLVQLVILKRKRGTFTWHPKPSKQSEKVMAKKAQILTFYDFTTGGTDIVDQLNDKYTTRSKFCRWIMVALLCMLYTARVNGKTVWCLKSDLDISST